MTEDQSLGQRSNRWRTRDPWGVGIALLSLIAIAGIVRKPGVRTGGWHGDDAWVVTAVRHSDSFGDVVQLGFTHPLFNAILMTLHRVSDSEVMFRLLPLLFSVAAVVAVFTLILQRTRSVPLGFVGALPLALSALHFRYAVAVKPYMVEVFAMAVVLLVVSRIDRVQRTQLVLWGVALLPLTLLSFRLAFISAVAAAGLWFGRKLTTRGFIIAAALHAALVLPWFLYVRTLSDQSWTANWWREREDAFPTDAVDAVSDLPQRMARLSRVVLNGPTELQIALLAAAAVGAVAGLWRRDAGAAVALAALLVAIAANAVGVVPFAPESLDGERIDLWLAPALLLLAAHGVHVSIAAIRDRVPVPGLAPAMRAVISAVVVVALAAGGFALALRQPAFAYPVAATGTDLQAALDRAAELGSPLLGDYENTYHLAAHFPESVRSVTVDTSHPRSMAIDLEPSIFVISDQILNERIALSGDGVVLSHILLRGPRLQRVRDYLIASGFVIEAEPARRALTETWVRPTAS